MRRAGQILLPAAGVGPRVGTRRRKLNAVLAAMVAVGCVFVTLHLLAVLGPVIAEGNFARLAYICALFSLFYWMILRNLVYFLTDYGRERRRAEVRKPPVANPAHFRGVSGRRDPLLILVPSYKEERDLIRRALVSAGLVEYPKRRVVLLIDDPTDAATEEDSLRLARSRALPPELQAEFDEAALPFRKALTAYEERDVNDPIDIAAEGERLARLYEGAAEWLEVESTKLNRRDSGHCSHADSLFIETILLEPARQHRRRACELRRELPRNLCEIGDEYRRLASLFYVEFSSFERKRYANLSHAPNKAMNLNSYIALIGKCFREINRTTGLYLEACEPGEATLRVPPAPLIATLDADSLITADFAVRLMPIMEACGNEQLAVAQTPYTAIPGAPGIVERTAAAETDVQFFTHQGMAHLGASWWVGASALIRLSALEDIAVEVEERGHKIRVFIQDGILIEDAAATVDLVSKGWRIYHDESRLSYSATPPDFGALIVQRRRWSNGGLLIIPALARYSFSRPWSICKLRETILRVHSLLSASVSAVGLPFLLLCRFDDQLVPLWLPFLTLPYFALYAADLLLAGYRWSDLPRVYVLSGMLLVPAYLDGTLQSLRQALTGRARPFKRTPKSEARTPIPMIHLTAQYALLSYCAGCAAFDAIEGRHYHMLFAILNGLGFLYGIIYFIGIRNSLDDFATGLRLLLQNLPAAADWKI